MKFLLLITIFVLFLWITPSEPTKTLYGNNEIPAEVKRTFVYSAPEFVPNTKGYRRQTRDVPPISTAKNETVFSKVNHLQDHHKQLMVHWVGEGSNIIICLARDPVISTSIPADPSAVYISYDYGDTYENKTDSFKLPDGNYSTLDKFYNHPKYNTHFVFTDTTHKQLYITRNHGRNITRVDLDFVPNEVSFHEYQPSIFVILDKTDSKKQLWLTEDFGKTFRSIQQYVKSFHWLKDNGEQQQLIIQRMEPKGNSIILYSSNLFKDRVSKSHSAESKDLFIKGDYIFFTVNNTKGESNLYVSHKLGKIYPCVFDTNLPKKNYFIVDVRDNRALVAVGHTDTKANLYVSNNLMDSTKNIQFTLSLEDVLCYFPQGTWHDTLIHHLSEDAFADVYRVEGLTGIYIASRVVTKPSRNNLGPQNLGSVITFDHGATWRLIEAPMTDEEGQPLSCAVAKNCSLHLSQKFSYLYPDTRTISIVSSKSAPGVILATGVTGTSLKGHYGVYVSLDAGLSWRLALKDFYFFNMGDHGGILTAVKYFKSRGETRHILYSTDEGETWQQTVFHDEEIRLYGLMTEPGENTTVFTMFGSLPEAHQWIIVKVDLLKAFKYNCTEDDYKLWSPSQNDMNRSYIPCVMGQQVSYKRRMPHANCYNGLNFDNPTSVLPCPCDILDYECDFGFIRTSARGHCVRNKTVLSDPYAVPSTCRPGEFYKRTKGYRKIQGDVCERGFERHYLPDEVPCPFNEVNDFLLFAQRQRISRFNLISQTLEELPVKNLLNVIAIDFDMRNNCVYWADIALDLIGRQCFNDGSPPEILVSSDLASIEGMALDWISNTLYFVDGVRAKIELIRTDISYSGRMRKTILTEPTLKKPRGIALHPRSGFMFWSDWSTENPSINRANLDGSNYKQLFGKPLVEWPNGITIDYIAERIYWVDAKQDYIASSDLHGDDMKKIISDKNIISHPFAVAVFKNLMFWNDWKRNAIFAADKDGFIDGGKVGVGEQIEVLQKQLQGLMDMKVFAHGIQIGTNDCTNSTCSGICVGMPKGHSCLCPDGLVSSNGDCLCPGGVKPNANRTCPQVGFTCNPEHFKCNNGLCVPKGWRCDSENDCGDNSDEERCTSMTCAPNYFVCGDGKCLPPYWRCDNDKDCADGSDEHDCPKKNCSANEFACDNGRCINKKYRCDHENDCKDNSDEMNCNPPEPKECKESEFKCHSGEVLCIQKSWLCDGQKDCRDGSDELHCDKHNCSDSMFSCGPPSHLCIYATWKCDGENDCANGKDEQNCTEPAHLPRPSALDPFTPKNGTCHDWMFKCSNNQCIPYWWKCDGSDDCKDGGSDEMGCPSNNITRFTTTQHPATNFAPNIDCENDSFLFQCAKGNCIYQSWICDGTPDCENSEDELNCSGIRKCETNEFRCIKDGNCVPKNAVCDGKYDCPDKTDESQCHVLDPVVPATPSCSSGYFPCDGSQCLPLSVRCNGVEDCKDGFDETDCKKPTHIYQVFQMGADERGTDQSTIRLYWWLPTPTGVHLEFLPSISEAKPNAKWENKTWTEDPEYDFTGLKSFTKYNMTLYVRTKEDRIAFPPAKYFTAMTAEGVPSEPYNVTVKQLDSSTVLVSWNQPIYPNGIITNYEICWKDDASSMIKLKLSGNKTSHALAVYFEHNKTYSFSVIAYNRKYSSAVSETKTLTFDAEAELNNIENIKLEGVTDNSVTLSWIYKGKADGFAISITVNEPYPHIPSRTTKDTRVIVNNLASGVHYTFKIHAYKKHFEGPYSTIVVKTSGTPLPTVTNLKGQIIKDLGTTARISWDAPKDFSLSDWNYGIYYGTVKEELFEKPRLNTTSTMARIDNLLACESYFVSVGLVGPKGLGPLASNLQINTAFNKRAPPKNLKVTTAPDNPLAMVVTWEPSCPSATNLSYYIRVHEVTRNRYSYIKNKNNTLKNVFDVDYGGIYEVSVATFDSRSIFSNNVTYYAPIILPPYEVKVFLENGSYVVYWQERNLTTAGQYQYEVFVSPGDHLDEANALRFYREKPPFIYTRSTQGMYMFAVRIKTEKGFQSFLSERVGITEGFADTGGFGVAKTAITVVTVLLVVSAGVIGILFIKRRRLQSSFTRFANSHYDTRLGAATFDDNTLEEEESPQIQGFSADEPLVIA